MSTYFESYLTVGAFAALGVVLVMIMLGVAAVLRPSKPKMTKAEIYECGVDPVGSGWSQTYIRYYVFGLLFLIFDVEAVFILPWAIAAEELGVFGLVAIILFTLTLIEGFVGVAAFAFETAQLAQAVQRGGVLQLGPGTAVASGGLDKTSGDLYSDGATVGGVPLIIRG